MSYKINSFITSDKSVASNKKRMSICLGSNGFSFSVRSNSDLLAIGDVECRMDSHITELVGNVKGVLCETDISPLGWDCELIVNSRQFVWIPAEYFDPQKQRDYLDAMCKIETGMSVFATHNKTIDAWMVFSADNNIVTAFKIAMPRLKISCQHDKMVNEVLLKASDNKALLLVNVREGFSDYAVFCNNKLQLSNTFECANFDETLYHALNLTKQFHLDDVQMTAAICGKIDKESFDRFRSFVPQTALYTGLPLTLTTPELRRVHIYRYALTLSD